MSKKENKEKEKKKERKNKQQQADDCFEIYKQNMRDALAKASPELNAIG